MGVYYGGWEYVVDKYVGLGESGCWWDWRSVVGGVDVYYWRGWYVLLELMFLWWIIVCKIGWRDW